jgi:hypothetical protein
MQEQAGVGLTRLISGSAYFSITVPSFSFRFDPSLLVH